MYQNSYQNGTYFDLFDPKMNQDKLKPLFKTANTPANNKVFDKDLKTFVLQFNAANSKMQIPRDDKKDLYLIQQYLVFQIYLFPGMSWNIELTISDLTKTKRRIMLSPAGHKLQVKPFFVKMPCHNYSEGVWNNLVIDVHSFIEVFKGQTYRSLDSISVNGHFKMRRVYTASCEPLECEGENQSQEIKSANFLPKNYYYPPGVPYSTKITKFSWEVNQEAFSEVSQPTVKYVPIKGSGKPRTGPHMPRLQKNQSFKTEKGVKQIRYDSNKKKKDFLANTNGTEMITRNKKKQQIISADESSEGNFSTNYPQKPTTKSVQKTAKKKQLTKTQQIPPKPRSSLEGYNIPPKKGKSTNKNKVNPWRSTKLGGNTDVSQLTSKNEDERTTQTPQTTSMLKTKNFGSRFTETKNGNFDKRSDHFSQNQYVELSQKFSTLTDGKFFKNELGSNHELQPCKKQKEEDQIEENIEENIEMQNSVHSLQTKEKRGELQHSPIHESIVDSLDHPQVKNQKIQQLCRASQYGFGQQLMQRFMGELQRPYSPPLGEKEMTQQSLTEHHQQKQQVQLIYDPVLNCYYDHRNHTYYQLKN